MTRADALALFRAREFDQYFPAADDGAVDPPPGARDGHRSGSGRPRRFDTGEREGKRSRAFCAPVRVPDEVYLVLRPHGGQTDWKTFLHELGHALHFAYMRPDHPMEFRWLGDNSVTEGLRDAVRPSHAGRGVAAALHRAWTRRRLPAYLRAAGFEELHFLRRYCAKLIYETQLYGGDVSWDALPDLYVEQLTDATSFRYSRADAFVDVDPRFYAARYLRAWQLQALIDGDARRAVRRGLVAESARGSVDRAGAVRRSAARAGAGAGGARVGEGVVVRAADPERRADARVSAESECENGESRPVEAAFARANCDCGTRRSAEGSAESAGSSIVPPDALAIALARPSASISVGRHASSTCSVRTHVLTVSAG